MNQSPEFISTDPNSPDFLVPQRGSVLEDIGARQNSANTDNTNIKIFAIGDSTVFNRDFPDGDTFLELGWADKQALGTLLKKPENLFDMARSGASSKSFKQQMDNKHDWEDVKRLIRQTDLPDGGYLLIQFGHNDESTNPNLHTTPGRGETFYNTLKSYVDEAKVLGLTPVLITPVERQYKHNHSHRGYAQTIRDLANDENILLLDLEKRSYEAFDQYESAEAIHEAFGYDDHTHFSPKGAKIVAGWVKELICASNEEKLCEQFK